MYKKRTSKQLEFFFLENPINLSINTSELKLLQRKYKKQVNPMPRILSKETNQLKLVKLNTLLTNWLPK